MADKNKKTKQELIAEKVTAAVNKVVDKDDNVFCEVTLMGDDCIHTGEVVNEKFEQGEKFTTHKDIAIGLAVKGWVNPIKASK